MPSPETTRRLCSLGLFVLPVLAVKFAAILLGGSAPTAAKAAEPAVAAVPDGVVDAGASKPRQWTRQQHAAREHVHRLAGEPFGPVPLLYAPPPPPPEPVVIEPEPEPTPEVMVEPVVAPVPAFEVYAVMAVPGGNKAVVNGRSYQVGDEVVVGWVIDAIDIDARSVTIVEIVGGRSVVVTVPGPT